MKTFGNDMPAPGSIQQLIQIFSFQREMAEETIKALRLAERAEELMEENALLMQNARARFESSITTEGDK